MDEGGVALDDWSHQGGEARIGEGETVLQPGDQLALGGDDAGRCGDGQPLDEGRVAWDVGIVDGRSIPSRGRGAGRGFAAAEQSHPDMLHRFAVRP